MVRIRCLLLCVIFNALIVASESDKKLSTGFMSVSGDLWGNGLEQKRVAAAIPQRKRRKKTGRALPAKAITARGVASGSGAETEVTLVPISLAWESLLVSVRSGQEWHPLVASAAPIAASAQVDRDLKKTIALSSFGSADVKALAALAECRLPVLPVLDEDGVELLQPGSVALAKEYCGTYFPVAVTSIVLSYVASFGLRATPVHGWDLNKLGKKLDLSFEQPYGLVDCDGVHLWFAGKSLHNRESSFTSFKIPIRGEGEVSVVKHDLRAMDVREDTARCGAVLFGQSAEGPCFISLKDAEHTNLTLTQPGATVERLWAHNDKWVVAQLNNGGGPFVVNHKTGSGVRLKKFCDGYSPDRVILHDRGNHKGPLVVASYDDIDSAKCSVVDVYAGDTGERIFRQRETGTFLYVSDDEESIICLKTESLPEVATFFCRYLISSEKRIATSVPNNGGLFPSEALGWRQDVVLSSCKSDMLQAVHPFYAQTVFLAKTISGLTGEGFPYSVYRSSSDKEGTSCAAIVQKRVLDTEVQRTYPAQQQLWAWTIAAKKAIKKEASSF